MPLDFAAGHHFQTGFLVDGLDLDTWFRGHSLSNDCGDYERIGKNKSGPGYEKPGRQGNPDVILEGDSVQVEREAYNT